MKKGEVLMTFDEEIEEPVYDEELEIPADDDIIEGYAEDDMGGEFDEE